MNIAIVSDAIYPYNKGGKEKRIFEVSTRLAEKGNNVTIYCMKWWSGKNTRIENGVKLHAISNLYPLYSGDKRSIKQAVLFSLSCFKLIKEDFDVIDADHMPHLILFPTKIVTIIKRKELIVTWNEVWGRRYWVEYMGAFGNLAYIIELLSSKTPNKITSVSEHTKKRLNDNLGVKCQINVITNGIDLKAIQKVKPSKNKSDIIFAGRLLSHKNVDILIKSVLSLKNEFPFVTCFIVGDGPEKKKLIKLTQELNLGTNIKFFDFFDTHNDLYSLIKASSVFVSPSTREGFGIVALEANACGIPAVVINHPDNAAKDLVNGKNGEIVEFSEKEIADSVSRLLKNKIDSKDCIKFVSSFDWDNISERVESVYKS